MVLSNADGPIVTADFARKLGTLVMQQKYPGFTFASDRPPSWIRETLGG
jgi:hypothetical protein